MSSGVHITVQREREIKMRDLCLVEKENDSMWDIKIWFVAARSKIGFNRSEFDLLTWFGYKIYNIERREATMLSVLLISCNNASFSGLLLEYNKMTSEMWCKYLIVYIFLVWTSFTAFSGTRTFLFVFYCRVSKSSGTWILVSARTRQNNRIRLTWNGSPLSHLGAHGRWCRAIKGTSRVPSDKLR